MICGLFCEIALFLGCLLITLILLGLCLFVFATLVWEQYERLETRHMLFAFLQRYTKEYQEFCKEYKSGVGRGATPPKEE